MAATRRNVWTIPAVLLGLAILALMGLHRLIGSDPPVVADPPDQQVVAAVQRASADPFRYGGRNIGNVLEQLEPRPGWSDAGWAVTPHPWGGYRVTRTYQRAKGGERSYAFTVAPDLDRVWPANGNARALMHRGPRPDQPGEPAPAENTSPRP
ncbi:MAG TPA: hypothetical protein VJ985_00900 [Gammaproteobacteria bacterium]|nr:hypothetical protein [Gammaproteobacteria bacterium]